MKAVCIIGSPREDGSTARLADSVCRGLAEGGFAVSRYCVGKTKIQYCLGCKKCYEAGMCVISDDMQEIAAQLFDAEVVVIASPSYWGDVTGQLKVFFDRSTPFGDTNPNRILHDKAQKGVAIAVRAGRTERENLHILESIEHYFGHLGIEPAGRLSVCNVDTPEDLLTGQPEKLEEAYRLGRRIAEQF